jgi:hypothetical protein
VHDNHSSTVQRNISLSVEQFELDETFRMKLEVSIIAPTYLNPLQCRKLSHQQVHTYICLEVQSPCIVPPLDTPFHSRPPVPCNIFIASGLRKHPQSDRVCHSIQIGIPSKTVYLAASHCSNPYAQSTRASRKLHYKAETHQRTSCDGKPEYHFKQMTKWSEN